MSMIIAPIPKDQWEENTCKALSIAVPDVGEGRLVLLLSTQGQSHYSPPCQKESAEEGQ